MTTVRAADPDFADEGSFWIDAQVESLAAAWRRGERPTVASILDKYPDLDDEAAVRLIYEEVCLHRETGLDVATSEVIRRYPRWRDDLEPLLGFDRLIRPNIPGRSAAPFPEVGERLGDFRLLAELGRGASGRTFLAAQPSLADRPVVLKVTARDHDEHLSLARLQHTHIVPLYSEQVFPDRSLRALCMPYLGGATLDRLLDDLAAIPADRRRGRDLLDALDRLGAPIKTSGAPPADGPFRHFLDQASYVQAACWIGACLADALQYAHDHGLVHMDVKPSNVLIAADGQPMLLDFHLAASPLRPGAAPPARLGGTPGWTSPEQADAVRALAEGRDAPRPVDGRSDLYSLGLLLDVMLGGPLPSADSLTPLPARPRLNHHNLQVGAGLSNVVRKCLEPSPVDRYEDAASLANDLRRHLNNLPLQGVSDRSLAERWAKWRRRRPDALAHGSARITVTAAALTIAALACTTYHKTIGELQSALSETRRLQTDHRFDDAARTAERGLTLARRTPGAGALAGMLERQRRLALLGRKADDLHALADKIRFRAGLGTGPNVSQELRAVAPRIRKVWDERAHLVPKGTDGLVLAVKERLETDLLELVLIWADLHVRLAPEGVARDASRGAALSVLNEAKAAFGPRPALDRERHNLAKCLGLALLGEDAPPPPSTAWEHDDLGRSYLRDGKFAAAAEEFRLAVDLRPQDFWPNFYRGVCNYRRNRFVDALASFHVCVALAPESAECLVNRALVLERLGRVDEAVRDNSRALALDRHLVAAYLNRGVLALGAGRPADAILDFRRALGCRPSNETAGQIRYNLALALRASGDLAAALAEARQAVSLGSTDALALLPAVPHG